MHRRTLLAALGAGAAALAGCTADPRDGGDENGGGDGAGDGDDGSPTTTPTATATPTPTATPSLAGADFEAEDPECGSGTDEVDVAFEGDRIVVSGTASGADACHAARLAGTEYDGDALTVRVESYVPESKQDAMCAQCLVDIRYTGTVRFEGDLPGRVVVAHDGERVTSADRPDATSSGSRRGI